MFKKQAKVEKIAVLTPYEHHLLDAEVAKERTNKSSSIDRSSKFLLKKLDKRKKAT